MILCIFGQRKTGKSYILEWLARGERNVLAIDPIGSINLPIRTDDANWVIDRLLAPGDCRIGYMADERNPEDTEDVVAAWIVSERGGLLIIDEADKMLPNKVVIHPGLEDLIRRGRHVGVENIAVAAQRPADIARIVTSQCSVLVVGRGYEPRDLQYLQAFAGSVINMEQEGSLLKEYEFLWIWPGMGKWTRKRINGEPTGRVSEGPETRGETVDESATVRGEPTRTDNGENSRGGM